MKNIKHILVFCLLFSALQSFAAFRENLLFTARIDGAQMVPANASTATGIASIMLNKKRDSLSISVSVNGLTPSFAAVYYGAEGQNGALLFDLTDAIFGKTILKKISGSAVKTNLGKLISNNLYLVIGSASNPGGEIRGQLKLVSDGQFVADLKGAEVVPAVSNNAFGLGSFVLAMDGSQVSYKVICQGLSGNITAVKLHVGASGTTGALFQNLSASISGNIVKGSFPTSPDFLDKLWKGEVYLNVSTTANPDGEIRSQLRYHKGISMESFSDGGQMVPAVSSDGKAIGIYRLCPTMDTLYYDIVLDNIATNIDYMHLHVGYPGQDYTGLQIDFSNSISGMRAKGIIKGSALSAASITRLLIENLTLITHTAEYPSGEIRGHVNRLAHEGYTLQLNGSGYGSGWVAINSGQNRAYYSWLAGDLNGAPTSADFSLPQNNQTIFDMTAQMQVSGNAAMASGVWKDSDSPAFLKSNAVQFEGKKVMLRLGINQNPGGGLVGLVLPGMVFFSATSAVDDAFSGDGFEFSLAPNPAHATLEVKAADMSAKHLSVRAVDIWGKTLLDKNYDNIYGAFQTQIDVSELPAGIYLLVVSDGKHLSSRKLLKI